MAITVTATQGGSTGNGMLIRVFVLTGAAKAASQTGAAVNQQVSGSVTWTQSITTSANSNVYGVAAPFVSANTFTGSNATIVDQVSDTTNGATWGTFHALNVTAGATTRGFTASISSTGPEAMFEILPAVGGVAPTEDASGTGVENSTTGAGPVTTPSFTPPGGSLLVALVCSNGGAAQVTFSLSNTGTALNWAEKSVNHPNGGDYAGVWIADVPAAAGGLLKQGRLRMFRQALLGSPPPAAAPGVAGTIQPLPTFPPPRRRLSRAVVSSGQGTTGIRGTIQPPPTLTPPRRKPFQRAVIASGKGGISPAGRVQPLPTIGIPRRKLARAVVQFIPVTTTNQAAAAAPAGTIQPSSTLTWPRRRLARSAVQFTPVRTTNAVLPPPVFTLPPGGSTEGELWRMYRDGDWPKRPPGFGPVGEIPSSGTPREQASGRGWVGKKVRRFFWPREED